MSIGASAIRAGEAFVEIFARDKTEKGIKTTLQKFRSMSVAVAALGATMTAASTAAFGGFGKALSMFSDFGSEIADSIARTSLSPGFTQALQFQASQAGASLQDVESAVRKMQQALGQAAGGNQQAAKKFEALGLSVATLLKLSPDQQFLAIAEAISRIEDPAKRTKLAMDVLGKGAVKLMGVLQDGSAGILQNSQLMQQNGLILSDEDIANADALGDAWSLLTTTLGAATRLIGAALAPAVTNLLELLQLGAMFVARFANANRGLTVALAITTVAAGGLGIGLTALGTLGIALSAIYAGLGTILTVVAAAWAAVTGAIGLIATPIGVVVLAIAGIGAAIGTALLLFFQLTETGRQVWSELAAGFGFFKTIALQTFGGIFAALMSGQWKLAGDVAMAGLNVAWQAGVAGLMLVWDEFRSWFLSSLSGMLRQLSTTMRLMAKGLNKTLSTFGLAQMPTKGLTAALDLGAKGIDKANAAGSAATKAAADQRLQDAAEQFAEAMKQVATLGGGKFKAPDWLKGLVGLGGGDSGLARAQAASSFGSFSGGSAAFQGIGKSSTFAPLTAKLEEGNALLDKILKAIEAEEDPEFG